MSDTTIMLTEAVYTYLKKNSLREPEVLKNLRAKTKEQFSTQMQISPEQGQLMALLVQMLGAKKTLDIGTFTGYSSLVVALALSKDGKVITCDISKDCTELAKAFWEIANVSHQIELKLAPALQTLDNLIATNEVNTFDFAFIDADKRNYPLYYEKSLTLLRPGGLIAIDNILWSGKVADESNTDKDTMVIRDLNAKILKDDRVDLSMLPMGDGLTLARKR